MIAIKSMSTKLNVKDKIVDLTNGDKIIFDQMNSTKWVSTKWQGTKFWCEKNRL